MDHSSRLTVTNVACLKLSPLDVSDLCNRSGGFEGGFVSDLPAGANSACRSAPGTVATFALCTQIAFFAARINHDLDCLMEEKMRLARMTEIPAVGRGFIEGLVRPLPAQVDTKLSSRNINLRVSVCDPACGRSARALALQTGRSGKSPDSEFWVVCSQGHVPRVSTRPLLAA